MKKKYFIQNNTIKLHPKTTEILHLFLTQQKKTSPAPSEKNKMSIHHGET